MHQRKAWLLAGLLLGAAVALGPWAPGVAAAADKKLFDNGNIYAVENGPTEDHVVRFNKAVTITKMSTYHWNDGQGTTEPGEIGLQSSTGEIFGPWQTKGAPGQGGVPNAYWIAQPNVTLPPGTYTVLDSDADTWSHNAASRNAGMAWAEGYEN